MNEVFIDLYCSSINFVISIAKKINLYFDAAD